jgi:hypothetical protein
MESLEELARQQQQNLCDFLKIELSLASTMIDLAKTTSHDERKSQLLDKAKLALDTVRYFRWRISDREFAAHLNREADRIETLADGVRELLETRGISR